MLERVAVTVTVAHPLAADIALTITLTGRVLSAIDMMLAGGVCVLGDAFTRPGTTRTYELAPSGVALGTLSEDPVLCIRARNLHGPASFGLELGIVTGPAGSGVCHRQVFGDVEIGNASSTWSGTVARRGFWTR